MTFTKNYFAIALLCMLAQSTPALENSAASDRILYIIFDGSNSMWGELPDKSRKIAVAQKVFNELDPALFKDREVALRLYGHRRAGDCDDIELAVPLGPANENIPAMAQRVNKVSPRGKTPITRSLQAALADIGDRDADILLISDGIETCDADPCDLVRAWRDNKINIRVHVVGLGLTDMARGAMACIAEASGTVYRDANSAGDLGRIIEEAAVGEPPEPGEPDPAPQEARAEFGVRGQDEDGNFVPVAGTLTAENGDKVDVKSNHRYVFNGGTYTLTAGVPTVNGSIYEPVTQEVKIKDVGSTKIVVTVPRPPRVTTQFIEDGEETRGSYVTARQQGQEVFGMRPNEEYFVLAGDYEFSTELNQDNKLSLRETIVDGEDKILTFEAVKTVRVLFVVKGEGRTTKLRQHQELLQGGELKYKLHVHNGGDVRPGVYTVQSDHPLTPYRIDDVEVSNEENQTIELTVPFGAIKPRYVFNGDPPSNDMRCWFTRLNPDGKTAGRSKVVQCDGREVLMAAGRYRVGIWKRLGNFEEFDFDVVTGQIKEVLIEER